MHPDRGLDPESGAREQSLESLPKENLQAVSFLDTCRWLRGRFEQPDFVCHGARSRGGPHTYEHDWTLEPTFESARSLSNVDARCPAQVLITPPKRGLLGRQVESNLVGQLLS